MSKIKILYILEAVAGGTKKVVDLHLKYIDKEKFDITVCLPSEEYVQLSRKNELNDPTFAKYLKNQGIRVIEYPMMGDGLSLLINMKTMARIYLLCKKERFHIVHTFSSIAGFIGRIAAKIAGIKTTIYSPEGYSFNSFIPKNKKRLYILLEKIAGYFTTAIFVCSHEEYNETISNKLVNKNKVILVENPIEVDNYFVEKSIKDKIKKDLGLVAGKAIIGMVARLVPQKNPIDFIDAAYLISKNIDSYFIIIGDGRLRNDVEDKIKQYGMGKKFHLLGNRKDYLDYMSILEVFVSTALWEGLPYAPLESLLLGVPVVLTNVTGTADILIDEGQQWIVKPNNPQDICDKVINILNNYEYSKNIVKTISSQIRTTYDAPIVLNKIEILYQQFVNSGTYDNRL